MCFSAQKQFICENDIFLKLGREAEKMLIVLCLRSLWKFPTEFSIKAVFLYLYLFPGNPKGAMLTHGNVVADFSGFLKVTEVNTLTWRVLLPAKCISF